MKKIIPSLFFFFICSLLTAQEGAKGNLQVFQDPRIDQLLEEHIGSKVIGYRVQIYFGNDKQEANEVKSDFLKEYEDFPAYMSWEAPYFKIRVGNFRSRLEAHHFLKKIQPQFEGAFIVGPLEMEYPSLNSENISEN